MLDISNVDSFYGRSQILHGLSLVVPDGQMMVILGRNGTGKTTLLKTIMGLTDRIAGTDRPVGLSDRRRTDLPPRTRGNWLRSPGTRDNPPVLH